MCCRRIVGAMCWQSVLGDARGYLSVSSRYCCHPYSGHHHMLAQCWVCCFAMVHIRYIQVHEGVYSAVAIRHLESGHSLGNTYAPYLFTIYDGLRSRVLQLILEAGWCIHLFNTAMNLATDLDGKVNIVNKMNQQETECASQNITTVVRESSMNDDEAITSTKWCEGFVLMDNSLESWQHNSN